jgi:hypothetical protein
MGTECTCGFRKKIVLSVDYIKVAVVVLHTESPDTSMHRPFHMSHIGLGEVDVKFRSEFFHWHSLVVVCTVF